MYSYYISLANLQASAVPIQLVVVTAKQDFPSHHDPIALKSDFPVTLFVRQMGHTTTVT